MQIQRQLLLQIERSLNEMIPRAREHSKSMDLDSQNRRYLETDMARAERVLVEVQSMIAQ